MGTVFHLNTEDTSKQSELLGNLKNLREDDSVNAENIVVLLNANGVEIVRTGSSAEEFVMEEIENGVEFRACSNSLQNREIDSDELIDGVQEVPSGVGEIVKRQNEGYNYIKI